VHQTYAIQLDSTGVRDALTVPHTYDTGARSMYIRELPGMTFQLLAVDHAICLPPSTPYLNCTLQPARLLRRAPVCLSSRISPERRLFRLGGVYSTSPLLSKFSPSTNSGISSSSSPSFFPSSPSPPFCRLWYDSASLRSEANESGPSWLRIPGTSSVSSLSSPLP